MAFCENGLEESRVHGELILSSVNDVSRAVRTAGEVLTHSKRPIRYRFHVNSGGLSLFSGLRKSFDL